MHIIIAVYKSMINTIIISIIFFLIFPLCYFTLYTTLILAMGTLFVCVVCNIIHWITVLCIYNSKYICFSIYKTYNMYMCRVQIYAFTLTIVILSTFFQKVMVSHWKLGQLARRMQLWYQTQPHGQFVTPIVVSNFYLVTCELYRNIYIEYSI